MDRVALYAGSFDPPTLGHIDVLTTAFGLFDRVVAAIGVHPGKTPMFTAEERASMLLESAGGLAEAVGCRLDVLTFDTLAVDFAGACGAQTLLRGLRDGSDLDYEMQLAGMNRTMRSALRTVFVPAAPAHRHITATLVRQIAGLGGDVSPFVPSAVLRALAAKHAAR